MIEPIALLSPIYVTFFWGVVFLFSSAGTDKAKQMLSVFMFAACGLYISHGVFFIGSPMLYFRIEPIYLFVNLSVYPLYYFYIRLLTAEETLSVKHLIWLLPALTMSLLSWLIGFYFDDNEAQAYVENFLIQRNLHFYANFTAGWFRMALFLLSRLIFVAIVVFILFKAILLLRRHEANVGNYFSNLRSRSMVWVKVLTVFLLITSCMSILFSIIGRDIFLNNKELLIIPSFIFSVMIFLIGYQGNRIIPSVIGAEAPRSLPANSDRVKEELLKLFGESKIFTDPELHIGELSRQINTNEAQLSQLINEEFKVSFFDFVNQYRVSMAKNNILELNDKVLDLRVIAIEAGFTSVESFVKVFKEYEGMSPLKYRELKDSLTRK